MDVYLVGKNFLEDPKLVQDFESLIWTERYQDAGNFELKVQESAWYTKLREPKYLISSTTQRMMMIETVGTPLQVNGKSIMNITGRGIENILQYRSAKHRATSFSSEPETVNGTVADIARYLVQKYAIDPATAGGPNVIPGLTAVNDVAGLPVITLNLDRADILSMVKEVCVASGLGFRITRNGTGLRFSIYVGVNKADPLAENYTLYAADNDRLINTSMVESVANFKNNVRVLGKNTYVDVYSEGYDQTVSGLDRRTLVIDESEVDTGNIAQDQVILRQRGLAALNAPDHKYTKLVDGDIPQNVVAQLQPQLGDIVQLKDKFGERNTCRVSELIWSTDGEGTKNTPTLEAII